MIGKFQKMKNPIEKGDITGVLCVDLQGPFMKDDRNRLSMLISNKLIFSECCCRIFTAV
jgi:hypothetical protein